MSQLILLLNLFASLAEKRVDAGTAEKLRLLVDLARAGKEGSEEFEKLTLEITAMVEAGREPTPEEFSATRARRASLSAQLQNLGKPAPTDPPAGDPVDATTTGPVSGALVGTSGVGTADADAGRAPTAGGDPQS